MCEAGHLTVDSVKYPSLSLFRTKYRTFLLLSQYSIIVPCMSL